MSDITCPECGHKFEVHNKKDTSFERESVVLGWIKDYGHHTRKQLVRRGATYAAEHPELNLKSGIWALNAYDRLRREGKIKTQHVVQVEVVTDKEE